MNTVQTILIVVQVILAIGLIGLILVQRGAGATAGAAMGGGASSTVFGSRGAGSFLTRTTAILATLFLGVSMAMAMIATRSVEDQAQAQQSDSGIMETFSEEPEVPAADPNLTEGSNLEPVSGAGSDDSVPQVGNDAANDAVPVVADDEKNSSQTGDDNN